MKALYPSLDEISAQDNMKYVPESLQVLLKTIFSGKDVVPELWSTLSATYCKKLSSAKLGMSFPFSAAAQHSNFCISHLMKYRLKIT
jgi:hypothetical protein